MSSDPQILTLLLDIKEQQGAFGAQMNEAQRARTRMEEDLKSVKAKVEKIEPVVEVVADLKPKVAELIGLRNRAAAVIVAASFILTAAFGLIFSGIKEFGPQLGKLFSKLTA